MKAILKSFLAIVLLCFSQTSFAQTKSRRILIENATVHVGNGNVFDRGLVGIEGDKIILVRNALAHTYKKDEWDTIINFDGQHLYPGFVSPNNTLGLTEIESVRGSNDFREVGLYNPHVRSIIAYNCESDILSTVRTNGVLITQTTPRGGSISGTSSVMHTSCWNWEDGVLGKDDGIHVNWPSSIQGGERWMETPNPKKRSERYEEEKRQLYSFFEQAETSNNNSKEESNIRFAAMKDCFHGTKRVYFHADELQQLMDILDFISFFEIKYPVIVGGYDSYLITEKLADKKIPVMLPRLHSLPIYDEDASDLVYRLPYILQNSGVKFCLQNEGDMEAMNARNIPFLAGTARSYGLTEEEAVRCVSLSACEILGIDANYGSIEEGKKATLFVSQGNALDMRTNHVNLILMDGKFVSVSNFQTELYLKYKQKYGM